MINAVQQEVPGSDQTPFGISVGKYFVAVYLLVGDQLMEFALLELHLLFEKVVVEVGYLAAVEAAVLPVAGAFLMIVCGLYEKIVLLLVLIVICLEGCVTNDRFSSLIFFVVKIGHDANFS